MPTRRVSFEESLQTLPKHFAADEDLILSHMFASLSAVFPDGEDFFVRSVRHFRDQITDPELQRQVAGFIGQESIHGREHRAFNDRLAELGYPTDARRADHPVGPGEPRAGRSRPTANLAATAALEHFTATLAELRADPTRSPAPCPATRTSATCSSGTRSRRASTRRSPSTSTGRSAAASAPGCSR